MPWVKFTTKRRSGRAVRGFGLRTVRPFFLFPFAIFLLACGCRSNNRYDLIEAELRTRNRELEEARAELQNAKLTGGAYQRAAECGVPGPAASPRGQAPALSIKDIRLGSGTGGLDVDGRPGDEALQVVIVPADDDGSAIKVPGRVQVTAFEISQSGLKTPIGLWDVPPDILHKHWKSGLLTTGYVLVLQWDRPPTTEKLRILVRLTTLDGRTFEADKDVPVTPLPGLVPRPGVEELPPPAIVPENPKKAAVMLPAQPG